MNGNEFSGQEIPPVLQKLLKNIRSVILVVAVVVVAWSGFFQVGPEEAGVIVRFGKYTKTVMPGLNFKIPFIEQVYKVPVERQQKLEFGFRTTSADVRSQYTKRGTEDESLMLTGDLNLADVEWVVQFRVNDPYKFLFKVRNPESTLRDVSEGAVRQIVGDRTVNEVLTVGRTEIAASVEQLIQKLANSYELGVKIDQVVLQDVNPPDPVKAAFNAVNEAQQEKETLINQAKSEYNKVIPKAKGQAEETIQKAEGYAVERVNNAEGQVARFNELYSEYVRAPEVTRQRIYLETLQKVLPELGNKIITDQDGNSVLPLLQMQMDNVKKLNTTGGNQ
ncbi:FtsH protease activity modulator HflK [Marinilabilia rubra]|uniref:Protein HflK n=1 Tax=Marinilabilia rubra TaxID=2162893 RepID=A0A2U2B6T1_9BACT|nr:FtsH protease activity modulator HflK [Marinilabilia rubra]PWD98756.1 FtsH protease activity modulator HflK [Marinilabilia rubra]